MKRHVLAVAVLALTILGVAAGFLLYQSQQERKMRVAEAEVRFNKGMALFTRELWAEAIRELDHIPMEPDPDWRVPYYQGSASIKLHDYEEAVIYLDEAFALNSAEARIPFALGVAYYRLGKLSLAKGYFAAALELDPANEDAKGLMDVMTNLERQQVQSAPDEPRIDATDGGT